MAKKKSYMVPIHSMSSKAWREQRQRQKAMNNEWYILIILGLAVIFWGC